MSANRRDREYARRRQEKSEVRRQAAAARRRRRQIVAWAVIVAVVASTVVGAVVVSGLSGSGADTTATEPETERPQLPVTDPALYDAAPDPAEAEDRTWTATLLTSVGEIEVELDGAAAPQAVASFVMLGRAGYFDGTGCHRLVLGALLQCGDPTATGTGGPGYTFGPIENAPEDSIYPAGTVAMARRGGDAESQGSQFFIVYADTPLPDDSAGGYTVFGRVTSGLDLLTEVDAGGTVGGGFDGQPAVPVTIERVVIP